MSLTALRSLLDGLPNGLPVAIILAEGGAFLTDGIAHAQRVGFGLCIVLDRRPGARLAGDGVVHLPCAAQTQAAFVARIADLLPLLAGRWVAVTYQSERLLFPFCETRSIVDLTTFLAEERRDAAYSTVVDLYSHDPQAPLSWDNAAFDRAGYYGEDVYAEGEVLERQTALYGGLRWRMEDHIPWEGRRLDRISLFRAIPGRMLREDLRLSDAEGNTRACPWHNSPTVAVASFRVALSLAQNPGSRAAAADLTSPLSMGFDGTSRQAMAQGFLEPGQWF